MRYSYLQIEKYIADKITSLCKKFAHGYASFIVNNALVCDEERTQTYEQVY